MRVFMYIGIIALLLLAPVRRLDAAKLIPVEAVAVYIEGERVVLATDTEDRGYGVTLESALADLKERALGVIYLDTANYLLIGEGAEVVAEDLRNSLKRSVRIGSYSGGEVGEEAEYLDAHWRIEKPRER